MVVFLFSWEDAVACADFADDPNVVVDVVPKHFGEVAMLPAGLYFSEEGYDHIMAIQPVELCGFHGSFSILIISANR